MEFLPTPAFVQNWVGEKERSKLNGVAKLKNYEQVNFEILSFSLYELSIIIMETFMATP